MHGRAFGRYQLIKRIGVGGMAEVFKAKQRGAAGFERLVAIKRVLPQIAEDREVIQMFVEEAKLAVQLTHPNIAQVFDLGEAEGHYFIAMEYVDGRSLKMLWDRWVDRGEPLSPEAVCYLVSQVAEALHYAHFAEDLLGRPMGIIHRDVSPQNILLSFGGEVKVIDFGLAKAETRASQTHDGVVKGKLAYLSPEQAHGLPIDRRTDLFALGVCAWEMLTGQRAFRRQDDRQTVLAIREGRIEPPSHHVPVPAELERIVVRSLARDPEMRYRTALELREDLAVFAKAARFEFGQRDVQALMRTAFPERFDEQRSEDGAIELVKRKAPSAARGGPVPPPPLQPSLPVRATPPPMDTVIDVPREFDTHDEFDDSPTDPGINETADAEDTLPNIALPEHRS